MADPWTDDFTALGNSSRSQLRSMAATRAHVLSAKETSKMRFFTNRPILALILILALVGVTSGAAYAVNRVFLSIDPDMTAPEIEEDVQDQLDQAGVQGTVHAEKTDGRVEIRIKGDEHSGSNLDISKLDIAVPGGGIVGKEELQMAPLRIELATTLTEAQQTLLTNTVSDNVFIDLLIADKAATTHDYPAMAAAMKRELATKGFKDVDIAVNGTALTVTVKSPPSE